MKAIIYSSKKEEKEPFIRANADRHELTWNSATLDTNSVHYAAGHQAVIVFTNDDLSCAVIANLAKLGVRYILTRSSGTDHIDLKAAEKHHIAVKNIPGYSPYAVAEHALMLTLALNRHLAKSLSKTRDYDFTLDGLTGFNIHGKTVGIIGLGHIGKVTAAIFQGFGCNVISYDTDPEQDCPGVNQVSLNYLYENSDIISLHAPLNEHTRYMISHEAIGQMKSGVMLINTARGALVNTAELITALDAGKIGYYGADVYEFEDGIFFGDHEADQTRDAVLSKLMNHDRALITPHQAFMTVEALEDIARQSIAILEQWNKSFTGTEVSETAVANKH
ncbi:2-hydroxyacid dehydrogenase [Pedobacter sp. JY14-1]|uniref:2-hydroxyacid dehydrogenase n=1 Tax=Pedobacter sp. JY14-1 TaxID=3034151 RepID=UPI0023E24913|nr:2-hydroxyacid dehydrogenase [Pedobacter sp. JY14-1]